MSWFTEGIDEAIKARKKLGEGYRPEFWLRDGETAEVLFLDQHPKNLFVHTIMLRGKRKKYTCLGDNCPLCRVNEPRFVSVYRIVDLREWRDKQGRIHKNEQKYYEVGVRAAPQLETLARKGKLGNCVIEITRTGAGMDSVYSFYPSDKKVSVPSIKLNFVKDYEPKMPEELETVAKLVYDNVADAAILNKPQKVRNYYDDDIDGGSDKDSDNDGNDGNDNNDDGNGSDDEVNIVDESEVEETTTVGKKSKGLRRR